VKSFIARALYLCPRYGGAYPRRKEILGMRMLLRGLITLLSGEVFSLDLDWDMDWDWEGKMSGISILVRVEGLCLGAFWCFDFSFFSFFLSEGNSRIYEVFGNAK